MRQRFESSVEGQFPDKPGGPVNGGGPSMSRKLKCIEACASGADVADLLNRSVVGRVRCPNTILATCELFQKNGIAGVSV